MDRLAHASPVRGVAARVFMDEHGAAYIACGLPRCGARVGRLLREGEAPEQRLGSLLFSLFERASDEEDLFRLRPRIAKQWRRRRLEGMASNHFITLAERRDADRRDMASGMVHTPGPFRFQCPAHQRDAPVINVVDVHKSTLGGEWLSLNGPVEPNVEQQEAARQPADQEFFFQQATGQYWHHGGRGIKNGEISAADWYESRQVCK